MLNLDYKSILLIDDILTTGTTAVEVARTLKETYPECKIYLLVLVTAKNRKEYILNLVILIFRI